MSDINVIARTQHLIVDPASKSVSVISLGPQGVPGPPGVGGTADSTLVTDTADWFTTSNVEDVLAEIGASLDVRDSTIVDHSTRLLTAETKIVDNDQRIAVVEGESATNTHDIVENYSQQAILNNAFNVAVSANSAAIVVVEARLTDAEGFEIRIVALESWKSIAEAELAGIASNFSTLDAIVNNLINEDVTINGRLASIEARLDALENPNP